MNERRGILRAATGLLIVKSSTAFWLQANSTVEVSIIGCGGRGITGNSRRPAPVSCCKSRRV